MALEFIRQHFGKGRDGGIAHARHADTTLPQPGLACRAAGPLTAYMCLQVGAGAALTDAHHSSHPPGVHSRGGGGGRKLGQLLLALLLSPSVTFQR